MWGWIFFQREKNGAFLLTTAHSLLAVRCHWSHWSPTSDQIGLFSMESCTSQVQAAGGGEYCCEKLTWQGQIQAASSSARRDVDKSQSAAKWLLRVSSPWQWVHLGGTSVASLDLPISWVCSHRHARSPVSNWVLKEGRSIFCIILFFFNRWMILGEMWWGWDPLLLALNPHVSSGLTL